MIKPIMSSPVVRKFAVGAMMAGAVAGMSSCKRATEADQITKEQLIGKIDRSNDLPSFVYDNDVRFYLDKTDETIEKNGTYYGIIEQTQKLDHLWYGSTFYRMLCRLETTDSERDDVHIVDVRLERNMSKRYKKDADADKEALCGPDGNRIPSYVECANYIDEQLWNLLPSEKYADYILRCIDFESAQGYQTTQTAANLLAYKQMQLDSVRCVKEIVRTILESERDRYRPCYLSDRIIDKLDKEIKIASNHVRPIPIKDPNGRGNFIQQIKDWFKSL